MMREVTGMLPDHFRGEVHPPIEVGDMILPSEQGV